MVLSISLKSTRAIGSGVEHILHTDGVTSSNLVSPTIETKGQDIRPDLFSFAPNMHMIRPNRPMCYDSDGSSTMHFVF